MAVDSVESNRNGWRRAVLSVSFAVFGVCGVLLLLQLPNSSSHREGLMQRFKNVCNLWGCETVIVSTVAHNQEKQEASPVHHVKADRNPIHRTISQRLEHGPVKVVHDNVPKGSGSALPVVHGIRNKNAASTAKHHMAASSSAIKLPQSTAFQKDAEEIKSLKTVIKKQQALIAEQAAELREESKLTKESKATSASIPRPQAAATKVGRSGMCSSVRPEHPPSSVVVYTQGRESGGSGFKTRSGVIPQASLL